MTAFGRRNGIGGMNPGARPAFGVAKPLKGPAPDRAPQAPLPGGEQFPPVPGGDLLATPSLNRADDAMSRLADRANAVHEQA
ncbi:hypothetical protein NS277_16540, partial [Novosphingobium barchaimii]